MLKLLRRFRGEFLDMGFKGTKNRHEHWRINQVWRSSNNFSQLLKSLLKFYDMFQTSVQITDLRPSRLSFYSGSWISIKFPSLQKYFQSWTDYATQHYLICSCNQNKSIHRVPLVSIIYCEKKYADHQKTIPNGGKGKSFPKKQTHAHGVGGEDDILDMNVMSYNVLVLASLGEDGHLEEHVREIRRSPCSPPSPSCEEISLFRSVSLKCVPTWECSFGYYYNFLFLPWLVWREQMETFAYTG